MKDNRILYIIVIIIIIIIIMTAILIATIVASFAVAFNYKPPTPVEKPSFGNCCSCGQSVEEIQAV